MEQVLEFIPTFMRAMLAGMVALTPGTLFWLSVLGAYLAIHQVARTAPFQRLIHRGR